MRHVRELYKTLGLDLLNIDQSLLIFIFLLDRSQRLYLFILDLSLHVDDRGFDRLDCRARRWRGRWEVHLQMYPDYSLDF